MEDKAKAIIQLWDRLEGERGTWKSHWQRIADLMLTNRADYMIQHSPGQKRQEHVVDGTAIWALEQFAAGLHSLLTSPSLQWFSVKVDSAALENNDRCRQWLDNASVVMYSLFNGPRHNFASQSTELYLDLGSIGSGVMAVLDSPRKDVLFSTKHMRECCIVENEEDRVDKLVRNWTWTAKQAFEQWGIRSGEKVGKAAEENPEKKFRFLHLVQPRLNRNPNRSDKLHKPFESVYVSLEDGSVIAEGGFDEFPYLVPRFSKVTGETYGRGPGMTALPDVQMLQALKSLVLKSAQKKVDPVLLVPDDGFMVPIKTSPGSLNYYRSGTADRIEPLETGGDVNLGVELLAALQQQIKQTFYVDLLMMPTNPNDPAAAGKGITATYVDRDWNEKMRLLSPMLARLTSEFLGPLIDRVFAIMWRKSVALRFGPGSPFPPPPPELSGAPLRVEYVSPIAVAQKSSQLDGVQKVVQTAMSLAQIDPRVPRILDCEAILRLTGKDLNTPAIILKSPEQVAQDDAQQAQLSQAANAHGAIANLAGVAKDGTAAIKNLAQAGQISPAAPSASGQSMGRAA